ncbi:MAG: citrate transporter [Bacteroidia bacterium]|nr:citrate transporter [Bacteroidia bacterium]
MNTGLQPVLRILLRSFSLAVACVLPVGLQAAGSEHLGIAGIRLEFFAFGLTLLGVALLHKHTLAVSLSGLVLMVLVRLLQGDGDWMLRHLLGHEGHAGEWLSLLNLFGLLMGFTLLTWHFEASHLPKVLPKYLPKDWRGGLVLLFGVMVISSFLDNIAAAVIGGTLAASLYGGRVHIAYIASIIAASNAGGAGSVVGDTTTTLMWIDGVPPVKILPAFIASLGAFAIFGPLGAIAQHRHQPMQLPEGDTVKLEPARLLIVFLILAAAIAANWALGLPALGVWAAILVGALIRKTAFSELREALPGSVFLIALVSAASLVPVEELPSASWQFTLALGFVSAVFDNIPLTKLCIVQGGYDWALLAYAVGFGGSMMWFGSSAGVALSNLYPESRSALKYLRHAWFIILAYLAGFFLQYHLAGWHPYEHRQPAAGVEQSAPAHP